MANNNICPTNVVSALTNRANNQETPQDTEFLKGMRDYRTEVWNYRDGDSLLNPDGPVGGAVKAIELAVGNPDRKKGWYAARALRDEQAATCGKLEK